MNRIQSIAIAAACAVAGFAPIVASFWSLIAR